MEELKPKLNYRRLESDSKTTVFYVDQELRSYLDYLKFRNPGTTMRSILNNLIKEKSDRDDDWKLDKEAFLRIKSHGTI